MDKMNKKIPKGERTRDRILETTVKLLREQGYHGIGVNDVVNTGGVPKGSIYYYFPDGKEQFIGEAILRFALDRENEYRALIEKCLSAAEAINCIFELIATEMEQSNYTLGSPMANTAMTASRSSDSLQAACSRAYSDLERFIVEGLRRFGATRAQAESLSPVIVASVEGALLMARAHRSTRHLKLMSEFLSGMCDSNWTRLAGESDASQTGRTGRNNK